MAPKAASAPVATPTEGTGAASDDSISPPAPQSVHGRQQRFMQALEEASTELKEDATEDVFPYGIKVPFKVRDAVPGNMFASARVFLSEAPVDALKDMCFYLQLEEDGGIDELVERLLEYFGELFPDSAKAGSARNLVQERVAAGPTPARARSSSTAALEKAQSISDLKERLTELGKPVNGSKDALVKRLQEAEAERAAQNEAEAKKKKRLTKQSEKEEAASLKKQKTTENLQNQYCVAGLSIAAQMKLALKASMEK